MKDTITKRNCIDSVSFICNENIFGFHFQTFIRFFSEEKTFTLRKFCQLLVDYVAVVHFELCTRIADGGERRAGVRAAAEEVFPRLSAITEEVVEFNDRYEVLTPEKLAGGLSEDLSRVGETLAVRFELEDRLFAALLARS